MSARFTVDARGDAPSLRGHVRKRGKESYSLVLPLGRDPQGRWRQRWVTFRGNRKSAELKLAELLVRPLDPGNESSDTTVGDFLLEWLSGVAPMRASRSTLHRY